MASLQLHRWRFGLLVVLLSLAGRPVAVAQPAPAFWQTEGQQIVSPEGEPVVLRGVGLGGWLLPEGYMLHIPTPDGGSVHQIRAQIEDLIGPDGADAFFARYRENYVQEKDLAAIADWGYDHVRLPFHYKLLYDLETASFREEGFALLDAFLRWCRAHALPVILDMHAAPGAQNPGPISDSDGTARLWTQPETYGPPTVKIWREIARRYADEPLIIGYDLLNEPVLPEGVAGTELRALFEQITEAVRAEDPNHILFIEGDTYATDFEALAPPFDDNMVYAFHKYWNEPTQASIQYLLDLRAEYDVPLWLGESGENANPWFFATTTMVEAHGIGWNWWTHKKIETLTSPCSIPYAPGYEDVLAYWRGEGPRPPAQAAREALFAQARALDLDHCEQRPGVRAALFRHPGFGTDARPYDAPHPVPGAIEAVNYDLGSQGTAYDDSDYWAVSGTPGSGNAGGRYRNDGVDIDASGGAGGPPYRVGWTEAGEWMQYTVRVARAGRYDATVRVASDTTGGAFRLELDGADVTGTQPVPRTGEGRSWTEVAVSSIELPAGRHALRFAVEEGGFSVSRFTFRPAAAAPR